MKEKPISSNSFAVLISLATLLCGCATSSEDLYRSQVTLYVEITGPMLGSVAMNYGIFISDNAQVEGKNPAGTSDQFPEYSNYPTYVRVGSLDRPGEKLDEISVTGSRLLKSYNITEFVRTHPARRYFFAIEKRPGSSFMPLEVWLSILSPDGRSVRTNPVIYDYGFDESNPALEFSIYTES